VPVPLVTAAGDQMEGDLLTDGTRLFSVWSDARYSSFADVFAGRFDPALTLLDGPAPSFGFAVSTTWNLEGTPAVASDAGSSMIAWLDSRDAGNSVYGARVSATGAAIDTPALSLLANATGLSRPAIAAGAGKFLVVSAVDGGATSHVEGALVSASDGSVKHLVIAASGVDEMDPVVDFDGASFFVVWHRSGGKIVGARVKPDGSFFSSADAAGLSLVAPAGTRLNPGVAFDGTRHLVVWEEPDGGPGVAKGVRVAIDGTPIDMTPAAIATPGSSPVIAAGGGVFLIGTWGSTTTASTINVTRVDGNGTIVGKTAQVGTTNGYSSPAIAFDGSAFTLAWADVRSTATGADVFATRILPNGTNESAAGFVLSAEAGDESAPALASTGARQLLLAYQRYDAKLGTSVSRVRDKTVSFALDVGAACTSSSACESGQCVDGVCCDRACDGACEACDVAGSVGTCSTIGGAPHGTRSCGSGDPSCGPRCDGMNAKTCATFVNAGAPCRDASCKDGIATHAATCDGKGACGAIETTPCGGFACDASGTTCRASCTTTTDCASGYDCTAGVCKQRTSTCSADGTSSTDSMGVVTQCSPYRCEAGKCRTDCTVSDDCQGGYLCSATNHCEAPPDTAAGSTDGSGGCALDASREGGSGPIAIGSALIAGLVVVRSRRRRRA
jgi:hypothetical protein